MNAYAYSAKMDAFKFITRQT